MRSYVVIFLFFLLVTSCVDKVICPAFQSTYILDDSTRYAYYSYVWKLDESARQEYFASLKKTDSTDTSGTSGGVFTHESDKMMPYYAYAEQIVPPAEQVNKTKFGIVKYEPYWLKNYRLRTAPMENVLGPEDEEEEPIDQGEFVAGDFATDSLAADSTSIAAADSLGGVPSGVATAQADQPKKKERKYLYRYREDDNFNVEQEYYNKYYGEYLVDNRPEPEAKEDPADSLGMDDMGFFERIFKNLFGGKSASDSLSVDASANAELNFGEEGVQASDSTAVETPQTPQDNNEN